MEKLQNIRVIFIVCIAFILLEQKISLSLMKNYVTIKICNWITFGIVIPTEKKEILELNQDMKSDKMPYIIYTDIKSLIRTIDGCANNPEKPSRMNNKNKWIIMQEISGHVPYGYKMSTIWNLIIWKTSILYVVEKTVWKVL